jgi:hypothetical protein
MVDTDRLLDINGQSLLAQFNGHRVPVDLLQKAIAQGIVDGVKDVDDLIGIGNVFEGHKFSG